MKIALCLLALSVCTGCEQLKSLALANRPLIEGAIVYGVRTGVDAGFKHLEKTAAKNPVNVTP